MNCGDIHKLLNSFQDDLLLEEEYQAFLAHLESCPSCKKYVRSIGSLSNQLWELGEVKVPEDLVSTIFFELKRPAPKPEVTVNQELMVSKKVLLGTGISVCVAALVIFGFLFLKPGRPTPPERSLPAITNVAVMVESAEEPPGEIHNPIPAEEAPEVEETAAQKTELRVYMIADQQEEQVPARNSSVIAPTEEVHWHVLLTGSLSTRDFENDLRRVENDLNRMVTLRKSLETKSGDNKKDNTSSFPVNYTVPKTGDPDDGTGQDSQQSKDNLARKETLTQEISHLQEQKNQIARLWQSQIMEQRSLAVKRRDQLFNILLDLGIHCAYDTHNFLAFTASGDKVEQAMREFSGGDFVFHDFGKAEELPAQTVYHVSIYLGQEEGILHWDIARAPAIQKLRLFQDIEGMYRPVMYKSEDCLLFSSPPTQIDQLRRRLQAREISFEESGFLPFEDDVLVSKPVVLSICFTK